jgi:hypothetical protein
MARMTDSRAGVDPRGDMMGHMLPHPRLGFWVIQSTSRRSNCTGTTRSTKHEEPMEQQRRSPYHKRKKRLLLLSRHLYVSECPFPCRCCCGSGWHFTTKCGCRPGSHASKRNWETTKSRPVDPPAAKNTKTTVMFKSPSPKSRNIVFYCASSSVVFDCLLAALLKLLDSG